MHHIPTFFSVANAYEKIRQESLALFLFDLVISFKRLIQRVYLNDKMMRSKKRGSLAICITPIITFYFWRMCVFVTLGASLCAAAASTTLQASSSILWLSQQP